MRKPLTVICAVSLVGAVLFGPVASARATAGCKPFKPVAPKDSVSMDPSGATKAKVIKVTDKHTKDKPLVVEYEHTAAVADTLGGYLTQYPQEDPVYFNVQSASKRHFMSIRLEWPTPSPSDIDLFVFSSNGYQVDSSTAWNPAYANPVYELAFGGDDGHGYEQILELGVRPCDGLTIESRPATTLGEQMKLKVWLS